ncbi:MAG: DUF2341 domain-containing protein [Euryarchaeota archaeon]|nr:DUF2341 domain-containing protein [Euryarchaeota archaeon]
MRTSQINIFFTAGVVALLLLSGCVSGIISTSQSTMIDSSQQKKIGSYDDAIITCSIGGIPYTQTISYESGTYLKELFSDLVKANAYDPCSAETQQLQQHILLYAEQQDLLPKGMSADMVLDQLEKRSQSFASLNIGGDLPIYAEGTGREMFCNFVSTGQGSAFPIIILPRFIPIIMSPIPRLFVGWKTPLGVTSCGGLRSGTGFIATGQQQGVALGFWGIGFSIFLPPVMAYGMFGYALFAKVSAEEMEYWPPNNPPEIMQTDPADGQQMVPITTTELRFEIDDLDNELMSYNVTTEPDIGSGSGGLKPSGIYSVPISGLEDLTTYSWHVEVTDGKDITTKTLAFTTEAVAPVISNPVPADGEKDVPMDLPQLKFTLKDYQGDTMDYTVQTSPNIGSTQGTDVHDGTYSVPIIGMTYGATYRWYVNVTDGEHWTREIFSFETGYPSQFDPFDFGWQYRKQITINHSQVAADLEHFPILIKTIDPDLQKAQDDGGDILFMDGAGVAKRQYHEIEFFDTTTGNIVAWVNIPAVSSAQDTVFYMYYGNPTCINQQNPEKTWNSDYQAVWHLNNNPSSTIIDSSGNNNDGTSYGGMTTLDLVEGVNGKCLDFDGTDDYISVPDSSNLKPTDVTLSAWFRPQEQNLPEGNFISKHCYDYWDNAAGQTYGFYLKPNHAMLGVFEKNAFEQVDGIGMYPIIVDSWHYLTLTFDESTGDGNFYVNGILEGTKNCDSSVLWYNNPWDFIMGGCRWGTGGSRVVNTFYNCALDEVRILNSPLSPGWITTEYNNQNNPSDFMSIGPEEPGP